MYARLLIVTVYSIVLIVVLDVVVLAVCFCCDLFILLFAALLSLYAFIVPKTRKITTSIRRVKQLLLFFRSLLCVRNHKVKLFLLPLQVRFGNELQLQAQVPLELLNGRIT